MKLRGRRAQDTPPPLEGGGWGEGSRAARTPPPNPLPQGEREYRSRNEMRQPEADLHLPIAASNAVPLRQPDSSCPQSNGGTSPHDAPSHRPCTVCRDRSIGPADVLLHVDIAGHRGPIEHPQVHGPAHPVLATARHLHIEPGRRTRPNGSPAVAAAQPVKIQAPPQLFRRETELQAVRHARLRNDRQCHGLGHETLLRLHLRQHPAGICGMPDTAPTVDTSHNPGVTSSDRPAARQATDPDRPKAATQQMARALMASLRGISHHHVVIPINLAGTPAGRAPENGTKCCAPRWPALRAARPPRHDRSPPPVLGCARTEWGRLP